MASPAAKCATPKGEASREEILRAAMIEFALHGLAGARTADIAKRAGVNIALLFYYFGNKAALYQAAVATVLSSWSVMALRVLGAKKNPRERVNDYVEGHFDFIAEEPMRASLIQGELSRRDPRAVKLILKLADEQVQPAFAALSDTIRTGIEDGDFREMDPQHAALSINGLIRSYFTSAPMVGVLLAGDPLSPANLKRRRAEVLAFIESALAPPETSFRKEK